MRLLRSSLFALALIIVTPPYAVLALATFPLPRLLPLPPHLRLVAPGRAAGARHPGHPLARRGARASAGSAGGDPRQAPVGLRRRWPQLLFPPQVLVLKRELLWIPFFGWGLALMSPIAIEPLARRSGAAQHRAPRPRAPRAGILGVVFSGGARACGPGERREYQLGGAWLAVASGAPIVPVAHNAGLLWPRNAFVKRPGVVTVRIGPRSTRATATRRP